ncbi:MAG: right-handed parallel beta-helix repeat-containing protein, partial [Thermoplasmata archaeon]
MQSWIRLRHILCVLLSLCMFFSITYSIISSVSIDFEYSSQTDIETNNDTTTFRTIKKVIESEYDNNPNSFLIENLQPNDNTLPLKKSINEETHEIMLDSEYNSETASQSKPVGLSKPVHSTTNRAPHPPIRINSDLEFDLQFPGRIISSYEINGAGAGTCIYIGNCSFPFTIENCTLSNANGNSDTYYWNSNIVIYNSTCGTIRNNNITYASSAGILIRNSMGNIIEKNDFYGNLYGIYLYQANDIKILQNGINYSNSYGIYLYESNSTISSWNQINRNSYGIYIYKGERGLFANETILNNGARGIRASLSNLNRFESITTLFHTCGIDLSSCNNNTIEYCNLSKSTSYGFYFFAGENNSVRNSTINENQNYGGYIDSTINVILLNCTFSSNLNRGIYAISARVGLYSNSISGSNQYGLYLSTCTNSYIFGNNITSINQTAIYVYMSNTCTFINNRIEGNWTGIFLESSQSCYFDGNKMYLCGFYIVGNGLQYWNTHVIPITNTVNGRSVYYWKNGSGGAVPFDGGQVILANYTNAMVDGLNLSCASAGVLLAYSNNNIIRNCDAHSNYRVGIHLQYSDGNNISNNDFSGFSLNGIYLYYSNANTILNNKIYNNYHDAIYLRNSESIVMHSNKMSYGGIFIYDTSLQYWNTHEISSTNTVNGRNVYYLKNGTDGEIPQGAGQIIIANYSHVKTQDHSMDWASVGVSIVYSNNITMNNFTSSYG